jgi:MtN3 and saliva related transmembrane protein
MNPAFIELVGSGAAVLTTAAFFPQAIKILRDRNTSGLSVSMYLLLVAGVALWLMYGLLIGSWPLALANGIVILPQLTILALILRENWRMRGAGAAIPLESAALPIALEASDRQLS